MVLAASYQPIVVVRATVIIAVQYEVTFMVFASLYGPLSVLKSGMVTVMSLSWTSYGRVKAPDYLSNTRLSLKYLREKVSDKYDVLEAGSFC